MCPHARQNDPPGAFTLIEVIVVVVILAILAAAVVPMLVGAADLQAVSASRVISADLQYAQNVAITSQSPVRVTFEVNDERYDLFSNASGTLKHPMTKADYVVDFRSQSEFGQVDIVSASFGGAAVVTFDELGSPDNGGAVTVQAGSEVYRIDVAPVTGTVTVTRVES
jgi:prepilin-type N-terminal cleavage/methylation domain-containing protein